MLTNSTCAITFATTGEPVTAEVASLILGRWSELAEELEKAMGDSVKLPWSMRVWGGDPSKSDGEPAGIAVISFGDNRICVRIMESCYFTNCEGTIYGSDHTAKEVGDALANALKSKFPIHNKSHDSQRNWECVSTVVT